MKFYYINTIFRLIACTWLCFSSFQNTFAQSNPKLSLLEKAYEIVYSNPDEAIKIGEHLLKNNHTNAEKTVANFLIAQGYVTKGNYSRALQYVFEAGNDDQSVADSTKISIKLLKSELLSRLYLDSQAKRYNNDAEELVGVLKSRADRENMQAKVLLTQLQYKIDRQDNVTALQLLRSNEKTIKKALAVNFSLEQSFDLLRGQLFNRLNQQDSAKYYLQRALTQAEKIAIPKNTLQKINILSEFGRWYFQNKQYKKATELLFESRNLAKTLNNQLLLKNINRSLSINYLALNDKTNYKLYNNEFLNINNELEQTEQESVNMAYNLISKEQEAVFDAETNKYASYFYNSLITALAIILIAFLLWMRSHVKKKRLQEIINYLEISRSIFNKKATESKESNKRKFIPAETERIILMKLKRFEASTKYTNNEMSLAVLAGLFDTNTKYLSEIINKHYGDNFNAYINKLRIAYIIQKLKDDPNFMHYKISYLAENCGFSSHSGFAKVFKSITGIAPIVFIELLKEERESTEDPLL